MRMMTRIKPDSIHPRPSYSTSCTQLNRSLFSDTARMRKVQKKILLSSHSRPPFLSLAFAVVLSIVWWGNETRQANLAGSKGQSWKQAAKQASNLMHAMPSMSKLDGGGGGHNKEIHLGLWLILIWLRQRRRLEDKERANANTKLGMIAFFPSSFFFFPFFFSSGRA